MLKVNTSKNAADLFTDREEPREAFRDQLYALDNDPEGKTRIITYYGEGGIGKTWLLNRIIKELKNEKNSDLKKKFVFVQYNLEMSQEMLDILGCFRAQIGQQADFAFPIFDTALKRYEEITNEKVEFQEPKGLTGTPKSITEIADKLSGILTLSPVPQVAACGILYKLLKDGYSVITKGSEIFADFMAKCDKDTKEWIEDVLRQEEKEDLLQNLPNYFYADLSNENRDFSLVFLLDTFELLEKEEKHVEYYRLSREIPGYIENSLWAFCGRDSIYHDKKTPEGVMVEEHLIGDLSKADSYKYLKEKQEIQDEKIIKRIYDITGGTPVFLDIAVKAYRQQGCPSAEEFNVIEKEQLVKRYTKYLNDDERHVLRAMSSIMHWTDEDFITVFKNVFGLTEFEQYRPAYNSIIRSTMIEQIDKERHFLHRSVRSAIYDDENYPMETKKKCLDQLLLLYLERVKDENTKQLYQVYYKERVVELLETMLDNDTMFSLLSEKKDMIYKILCSSSEHYKIYGVSFIGSYIFELERLKQKGFETEYGLYGGLLQYLYLINGNYDESRKLGEEVLEQRKKILGEDHTHTIGAKQNLALSYSELGMYDKAFHLREEVMEQRKRILGEDHLDTINAKQDLSISYSDLGMYDKALHLKEEVLEQRKRIQGEDHLDTIAAKNNLANSYSDLGMNIFVNSYSNLGMHEEARHMYDKAFHLREEILEQRKRILGEDHLDTIRAKYGLSTSYRELHMYDKAFHLSEEVLEQWKKILGEDHPDTIKAKNNLANSYSALRMYDKAFHLSEEVLEQQKKVLGEDHPNTIKAKNNLANSYSDLGMYEEALHLREEVLEQYKKILGEDHPDTIKARTLLANSYSNLSMHEDVLHLREEALEQHKKILGEDHLDTIKARTLLANSYSNLGMYEEALHLREEVLEQYKKILGEDHPDTIKAKESLAFTYSNLGMYEEALHLREEVLEQRKKILGEKHRDTIKARTLLAESYSDLGMHEEAQFEYFCGYVIKGNTKKAIEIGEKLYPRLKAMKRYDELATVILEKLLICYEKTDNKKEVKRIKELLENSKMEKTKTKKND